MGIGYMDEASEQYVDWTGLDGVGEWIPLRGRAHIT